MAGKARLAEIADELDVAASWVAGERTLKLRALAEELRGTDAEAAAAKALESYQAENAPTVVEAEEPTEQPEEQAEQA